MVRRAVTAYFGLVSFLDHNIGRVLAALEEAGLMDDTRIVYSSDHGDNLGARGMWGKSTMFEESAGIPMIVAGEGVPAGQVSDVPVTLVDLYQTILQGVGAQPHPDGVRTAPRHRRQLQRRQREQKPRCRGHPQPRLRALGHG